MGLIEVIAGFLVGIGVGFVVAAILDRYYTKKSIKLISEEIYQEINKKVMEKIYGDF